MTPASRAQALPSRLHRLLQWLGHPHAAAWIVGAGVTLRILALFVLAPFPLAGDGADYDQMARQLAGGSSFDPDWPPGLGYYLALWYRLTADPFVVRGSMILFYLGLSWTIGRATQRLFSLQAANLSRLILALCPAHILHSVVPLTPLPAALLLAGAFVLTVDLATQACRGWPAYARIALLGICLGALVLVRPSSVLLAAALPLVLAWRRRSIASLLLPTALAAALVFAWMSKTHDMTGRWFFINKANSQNLFYGNNPWTPLYRTWWFGSHKAGEAGVPDEFVALHRHIGAQPPDKRDRLFTETAVEHIQTRPDLFLVRSMSRVRCYFAFDTFTATYLLKQIDVPRVVGFAALAADAAIYVLAIGLAAFFACTRKPLRGPFLWALFIMAGYSVPYFLSFSHPTYHFPVLPLFLPFSAASLVHQQPVVHRRALVLALAVLALIQVEWVLMMADRV